MLIGIIGESCVGKSTLAARFQEELGAEIFTGKDYLRMAKNEAIAKKLFQKKLSDAIDSGTVVYVISEREHFNLLPDGAIRILMTADMDLILGRFAARMHGNLPEPVRKMLEAKHGLFDREHHAYHIHNGVGSEAIFEKIREGKA